MLCCAILSMEFGSSNSISIGQSHPHFVCAQVMTVKESALFFFCMYNVSQFQCHFSQSKRIVFVPFTLALLFAERRYACKHRMAQSSMGTFLLSTLTQCAQIIHTLSNSGGNLFLRHEVTAHFTIALLGITNGYIASECFLRSNFVHFQLMQFNHMYNILACLFA